MNIFSSQAFSKHITQLHQQPCSWLCQEQAKLQYCRTGRTSEHSLGHFKHDWSYALGYFHRFASDEWAAVF